MTKITIDTSYPPNREELIELREYFEHLSKVKGTNPTWSRAYLNIADALDRLDAMQARCAHVEIKEPVRYPDGAEFWNQDEK